MDKTAAWLNESLTSRWKVKRKTSASPPRAIGGLDATHQSLPWAVTRALSGNAAERALYAFAFGELAKTLPAPFQGPSAARTWAFPVLAHLKSDPYLAIRHIAERSLRELSSTGPLPARSNDLDVLLSFLHDERDDTPLTISE